MKIGIVTGSSSGIGREFVRQISKDFSSLDEIWVIARRIDRLNELQKELKDVYIRPIKSDITTDEINIIKENLEKYRPYVKILVNSAGMGMIGHFDELSMEDNLNMVSLNCMALTKITKFCLPYMKVNSVIINLASSAAFLPQPSFAIYAATKSFVYSFSMALSKELANKKIRVCAVCPGPVSTEFFDKAEKYSKIKVYKKLFQSKPENVVKRAIIDVRRNKKVSIYGPLMNIFRVLCKILPHGFIIKFIK